MGCTHQLSARSVVFLQSALHLSIPRIHASSLHLEHMRSMRRRVDLRDIIDHHHPRRGEVIERVGSFLRGTGRGHLSVGCLLELETKVMLLVCHRGSRSMREIGVDGDRCENGVWMRFCDQVPKAYRISVSRSDLIDESVTAMPRRASRGEKGQSEYHRLLTSYLNRSTSTPMMLLLMGSTRPER